MSKKEHFFSCTKHIGKVECRVRSKEWLSHCLIIIYEISSYKNII